MFVRRRSSRLNTGRLGSGRGTFGVILFPSLIVAASLGGASAPAQEPGVVITPNESQLWEGTWLTAGSSLEDNVYFMLSVEEAGIRSFTYELEDRAVPYGPNAQWFDGIAVFVDPTEATDSAAGRTFRLRVDPGDRDQRIIELDGESFLLQRSSGTQVTATAIGEAGAYLDAMVACISDNFEAIAESSGETAPDMGDLGARCDLDQDSLSELADALVRDALMSHVMFGALAIGLGDVEEEAAAAMLVDALTEAADSVRAMEVRGQLDQKSEREVLEAFYRATGGPDWQFNSGWLSDLPLSAWSGVTTNAEGRVHVLGKANARASGPIPPELGQLTGLEVLMLSFNEFSGPIPSELAQLTSLVSLFLRGSPSIGPIPSELGQLTNLTRLGLQVGFSGPIPPELGLLTNLRNLVLGFNQLDGPIPVELGDLELTSLSIDGDTGLCLPAEIQDTVFGRLAIDMVSICGTPGDDTVGEFSASTEDGSDFSGETSFGSGFEPPVVEPEPQPTIPIADD